MNYFSRRNQHVVEFSGHEEVSASLRARLLEVLNKYARNNPTRFSSQPPNSISLNNFCYNVRKQFPGKNALELVKDGEFHEVFTVVEIFLDMTESISYQSRNQAVNEIQQAFNLSGSVYFVRENRIELAIDNHLAENLEKAKAALAGCESAYEKFFDSVGDLVGRRTKNEDIVKDVFVAFEDFLKKTTSTGDYKKAIEYLQSSGLISSTQKALLDKVYAYRSDSYGVGHAGGGAKPDEVDTLWFVDTVTAQVIFIDRKLKSA